MLAIMSDFLSYRRFCIISMLLFFSTFPYYARSAEQGLKGHDQESKITDLHCLVIPENKSFWDKKAISEIRHYYKKITGKELKNIETKAVKTTGNIFLGSTALASGLVDMDSYKQIAGDGFIVVSDGRNVAICGKNHIGNLYGVYSFLDKIGMEIYAPDSEVVPDAQSKLEKFKYLKNPSFGNRVAALNFYYYPQFYGIDNLLRLGYTPEDGKSPSSLFISPLYIDNELMEYYKKVQGWIGIGPHNAAFLCPPNQYMDTNPEYYARDKAGKLFNNKKTNYSYLKLCYSNPEVFEIAKARLLLWMEKTPLCKYYYITDGDSKDWCQCAECRKLDPPGMDCFNERFPHNMSDRILKFVNKLAREIKDKYPDKIIITSAYQSTAEPPLTVKTLEPNVLIDLCPSYLAGAKCQVHDLTCPRNRDFLKIFKQWAKIAKGQLRICEYPMDYNNIYAPIFSHDAICRKLKFYHQNGVTGIYFCGQPYTFAEMFLYVQGKLAWDINLDPDKLESKFMQVYYGPAAPYLKKFITLYRSRLYANPNPVHQTMFDKACPMLNKDFVKKAYAIFTEAEKSVPKDSKYYKRVKYEKLCGVLYGDLDQYITTDIVDRYALLKELAEICRMSDPKAVYRLNLKADLKEWLAEKFQIKLADFKAGRDDWYNSAEIKKLLKLKTRDDIKKFVKKLQKASGGVNEIKGSSLFLSLWGFKVYGTRAVPEFLKQYQRYTLLLAGQESMTATFNLAKAPRHDIMLKLEGLDDDKKGKTPFTLKINNNEIIRKTNAFSEKSFSSVNIRIPAAYFKRGANTFSILNTDSLEPMANWLMISKVELSPVKNPWKILKIWDNRKNDKTVILSCAKTCSASINLSPKVKTPHNEETLCLKVIRNETKKFGNIQLIYKDDENILKKDRTFKISLWVKSSRSSSIRIIALRNQHPYTELAGNSYTDLQATNKWKWVVISFKVKKDFKNVSLPRIFLGKAEAGTTFYFSPVTVETEIHP